MARRIFKIFEIGILSALILATRCANYQEVFVGGNVYFTDADCYARMTRVRMCAEHPGLIIRHHEFENFPAGTTPHTTTPLDYLILGLSILLRPFNPQTLDLAGALISPLLALISGCFLWWWSAAMKFRYRWTLLILFATSPILVHGTALGRPDHQSLLILLVTVAICAEWSSHAAASIGWTALSRAAWGLAIWVSAYEPLVLLLLVLSTDAVLDRHRLFAKPRRIGWILFAAIIFVALLIERRIPSLSIFRSSEIFDNWSRSIGEMAHVSPASPIWLRWCGYMLLITPVLILWRARRSMSGRGMWLFPLGLVVASYALTIWQARWAYFFVLIFALSLPALLEPLKSRTAVWVAFALSILPVAQAWDDKLWLNEAELARQVEHSSESIQLRDMAVRLQSTEVQPFLAPWWLSPSIAYWSSQPGVAGSSHESLNGIAASARFYAAEEWTTARTILTGHDVAWVFSYDADRVMQNSSAILGSEAHRHALCFVLDRTPRHVPRWLIFSGQDNAVKLYRVANDL